VHQVQGLAGECSLQLRQAVADRFRVAAEVDHGGLSGLLVQGDADTRVAAQRQHGASFKLLWEVKHAALAEKHQRAHGEVGGEDQYQQGNHPSPHGVQR